MYTSLHLVSKTDPFYYSLLLFNLCTALGECAGTTGAQEGHIMSEMNQVQIKADERETYYVTHCWV